MAGEQGQLAEAEAMLRDALELMPSAIGEGAAPTMHACTQLGLVLLVTRACADSFPNMYY